MRAGMVNKEEKGGFHEPDVKGKGSIGDPSDRRNKSISDHKAAQ